MSTATTDLTARPAPRTRIERSSAGVIAAYIHSHAQLLRSEPEQTAQDPPPASAVWNCRGRLHRAPRLTRLAEAL